MRGGFCPFRLSVYETSDCLEGTLPAPTAPHVKSVLDKTGVVDSFRQLFKYLFTALIFCLVSCLFFSDEYDYNMSSCDPRTQCHTVIFFASPSEEDGDCYSDGNTELL